MRLEGITMTKQRSEGFKPTPNPSKPKKQKDKRIPIVITDTQYHYLEVLASRKSMNVGAFILDLIESHMDTKLLIGDLEWNVPDEHRPNRELVLTLKALMYGELNDDEKLTTDDIKKVSRLTNCPYDDVIKLLSQVKQSSNSSVG